MAAPIVIDAHQRPWWNLKVVGWPTPDLAAIYKTFGPADLIPLCKSAGVHGTVFVQVEHNMSEIDSVWAMAQQHSFICGIVGWVDLTHPDLEATLDNFAHVKLLVGIRHLVHNEADENWLLRADVHQGFAILQKRGLTFDLLLRPVHLKHVPALAQKFPALKFVIDHIAKPAMKASAMQGWQDDITAASQFQNVFCKLSGMVTEAALPVSRDDIEPFLMHAYRSFGAARCMFGSDWPVSDLALPFVPEGYGAVKQLVVDCLGAEPAEAVAAVMGGTAVQFYGLSVAALSGATSS